MARYWRIIEAELAAKLNKSGANTHSAVCAHGGMTHMVSLDDSSYNEAERHKTQAFLISQLKRCTTPYIVTDREFMHRLMCDTFGREYKPSKTLTEDMKAYVDELKADEDCQLPAGLSIRSFKLNK